MPKRSGFILLLGIIIITAILILASSQFDKVAQFVRFGSNKVMDQQALVLAEAGVDYALWQLNQNAGSWYGSGTEIAIGETGTFFVTVTDVSENLKKVFATGYVPNSTNPRRQIAATANAYVDSETISFNYAVQIGDGGIHMENSANITGTTYTNGNISGKGDSIIDGDAYAVGTISSPDPTVTGTKYPGSDTLTMPTFDYQFWKDAANINNNPINCTPTCTIHNETQSIGPQLYNGNLTINGESVITITGPVYVTGNISILNSAQVNLAESFGSTGTVIITDAKAIVRNSATVNPTNATPKGYIILVTTLTDNEAMEIENTGANALLYALEGGIELENEAQATALVAKRLEMENGAHLTYDSGLASAQFSSGPGGSWVIQKGSFEYTR